MADQDMVLHSHIGLWVFVGWFGIRGGSATCHLERHWTEVAHWRNGGRLRDLSGSIEWWNIRLRELSEFQRRRLLYV